jgi:hypothetical protein
MRPLAEMVGQALSAGQWDFPFEMLLTSSGRREMLFHNLVLVLGFDLYHPNTPPAAPPSTKTKIRIGTGILTGLPK